jgi:hypothetical protein
VRADKNLIRKLRRGYRQEKTLRRSFYDIDKQKKIVFMIAADDRNEAHRK